MKNPNYKGIELLPLSVIEAARAGDAEAVERVLRYYEGYINKLCTRTLYDEYGQPHVCVDEYMKHRLENKLIYAIVCNSREQSAGRGGHVAACVRRLFFLPVPTHLEPSIDGDRIKYSPTSANVREKP